MKNSYRNGYKIKNSLEKEAYRNFLSTSFKLDKTEEEPENFSKSDSSTFEKEDLSNPRKTKHKSLGLKIKDFFNNNWVTGIGVGLILLLVGGGIKVYTQQSTQEVRLTDVEDKTTDIDEKVEKIEENLQILKEDFRVFQTGTSKDLEYWKLKISR